MGEFASKIISCSQEIPSQSGIWLGSPDMISGRVAGAVASPATAKPAPQASLTGEPDRRVFGVQFRSERPEVHDAGRLLSGLG